MIRRTSFYSLLATAVGIAALACGGDDLLNPADLTGTYALASVNGENLPTVIEVTDESVTRVVDGSLIMEDDRDYSISLTLVTTAGGEPDPPVSFDDEGVYSLRDRSLFFVSASRDTTWVGSAATSRVNVEIALEGGGPALDLEFSR